MDRFLKRCRFSFFHFVHLFHKQFHGSLCDHINLLSDSSDRDDGLRSNGRIIESDDLIFIRQTVVFLEDQIEKYICVSIIG